MKNISFDLDPLFFGITWSYFSRPSGRSRTRLGPDPKNNLIRLRTFPHLFQFSFVLFKTWSLANSNNRIKLFCIFKSTLTFKLKKSMKSIKSLDPKNWNRQGLDPKLCYSTDSSYFLYTLLSVLSQARTIGRCVSCFIYGNDKSHINNVIFVKWISQLILLIFILKIVIWK